MNRIGGGAKRASWCSSRWLRMNSSSWWTIDWHQLQLSNVNRETKWHQFLFFKRFQLCFFVFKMNLHRDSSPSHLCNIYPVHKNKRNVPFFKRSLDQLKTTNSNPIGLSATINPIADRKTDQIWTNSNCQVQYQTPVAFRQCLISNNRRPFFKKNQSNWATHTDTHKRTKNRWNQNRGRRLSRERERDKSPCVDNLKRKQRQVGSRANGKENAGRVTTECRTTPGGQAARVAVLGLGQIFFLYPAPILMFLFWFSFSQPPPRPNVSCSTTFITSHKIGVMFHHYGSTAHFLFWLIINWHWNWISGLFPW